MKKRGKSLSPLRYVVDQLVAESAIPAKYRDHKLEGIYKGHRECHIQPDWLLIYKISEDVLILTRTGTHSDLF